MEKPRSLLAEVVEVAVLAIGLYLVITFAVQNVHVLMSSMFPTLDDGDYLIATKVDYRLHSPQRGDIVVLRDPYDPSKDFIKRVIGVPKDDFAIQNGQVYINGRVLDEPYINPEPWTINANYPNRSLGTNEYFVMGDNRNRSSDSRMFGPVQKDQIQARAWVRIWPLDHFGPVDNEHPRLQAAILDRVLSYAGG